MPVVLADLVLGAALVATIAFAARRARCATALPGRRLLGWLLIAAPLPLVVALRLSEGLFIAGVVCFAVGAALVLTGDEPDELGRGEDPEPPWWPDFERDFRAYARPRPRPRALRELPRAAVSRLCDTMTGP